MENKSNKERIQKNMIVIVTGMLIVTIALLITLIFQLSIVPAIVLCWILTTLFAIWGILVVDPKVSINPVQIVEREVVKEVPVEKKIFIDRPVIVEKDVYIDRPVITEKEVIREVPVEVERIIYKTVQAPHRNLNIPKYEFVGSTQAETYHKRTCRFSKLIKNKYKLHSNYAHTFKIRNFKACKACINMKKKA
ncbi:MAG: hypothetical protein WCI72_02300 [archaeon]